MYLYREHFKANVYAIWVHGPLGLGILRVLFLGRVLRFRVEVRTTFKSRVTQRAQYPLVRKYGLNYIGLLVIF